MKKLVFVFFIGILIFSFINGIAAREQPCYLNVSLINQDPYPAVPGDYVKLVFQVSGIEDPKCELLYFELLQEYPIKFDPGTKTKYEIKGGTFVNWYEGYAQFPFKVKVDKDALDGENPIKVKYTFDKNFYFTKEFNLTVENPKTDFELFVKNYDFETKEMSIEILNIGENDVEAVTIEIPRQEGMEIKGANRYILGDLDSNEYSTADFKIIPQTDNFKINIFYTDSIGKRRNLTKTISFIKEAFEKEKKSSYWQYVVLGFIILIGGYVVYKKRKGKKKI